MKTIITADRTCDLCEEVVEKYNIKMIPYHIILGNNEYRDNIDITLDEVFDYFEKNAELPRTAAVNVNEYIQFFESVINEGKEDDEEACEIVHITLGSSLTSSYQNCVLAAQTLKNVYPVDSCTLSSATGLMVIDAAKMASEGKSASEIQKYLQKNVNCYHASFVLGTLEYLKAGGRCSSIAALAATALKLHPSITVNSSKNGEMTVGKKYRGKLEKAVEKYVYDELAKYDNINYSDIMITASDNIEKSEHVKLIYDILTKNAKFENIYIQRASCTICSHCGPNCIGILFRTKA